MGDWRGDILPMVAFWRLLRVCECVDDFSPNRSNQGPNTLLELSTTFTSKAVSDVPMHNSDRPLLHTEGLPAETAASFGLLT